MRIGPRTVQVLYTVELVVGLYMKLSIWLFALSGIPFFGSVFLLAMARSPVVAVALAMYFATWVAFWAIAARKRIGQFSWKAYVVGLVLVVFSLPIQTILIVADSLGDQYGMVSSAPWGQSGSVDVKAPNTIWQLSRRMSCLRQPICPKAGAEMLARPTRSSSCRPTLS